MNRFLMRLRGFGLVGVLLLVGCTHTAPTVMRGEIGEVNKVVGVKSFYDSNGFNYVDLLRDSLEKDARCPQVIRTHDIADPRCEYVVQGDFCYGRVKTRSGFYYGSIYLCLLPTLTGLPTAYLEGRIDADYEVYRSGELVRSYHFEDVFRESRSFLTLWPSDTSFSAELTRLNRLFIRDFAEDFGQ